MALAKWLTLEVLGVIECIVAFGFVKQWLLETLNFMTCILCPQESTSGQGPSCGTRSLRGMGVRGQHWRGHPAGQKGPCTHTVEGWSGSKTTLS